MDPISVVQILHKNPRIMECQLCGHENAVLHGSCFQSEALVAILFHDAETLETLRADRGGDSGVASDFGADQAHLTTDPLDFMHAIASECIAAPLAQLQSWIDADDTPGGSAPSVIDKHCTEIGPEHFAALFVNSSGALRLGLFDVDASFGQDHSSPPGFPTNDMIDAMQRSAGQIAYSFAWAILRHGNIVENDITWGAKRVLRAIPTGFFELEGISSSCESMAKNLLSLYDKTAEGALTTRYWLEAAWALCCFAAGTENPDKITFTRHLAFFELIRTRDKTAERQLLDPELLRELIDREFFLEAVRTHALELLKHRPHDMSEMEMVRLVDQTVQRVYPGELTAPKPVMRIENPTVEMFRELAPSVLSESRASNPSTLGSSVSLLLDSATDTGEDAILAATVEACRAFSKECSLEDRLRVVNALVSGLNSMQDYETAGAVANEMHVALGDEPEVEQAGETITGLADFYCELGNCYRYAAEHEAALDEYRRALALSIGRSDRDEISLQRNIAIVLRDAGQLTEAETLLERMLRHAPSDMRPGLLTSRALCLFRAGRRDEGLDLLYKERNAISGRSLKDPDIATFARLLAEAAFLRKDLNLADEIYAHLERSSWPTLGPATPHVASLRRLEIRRMAGAEDAGQEWDDLIAQLEKTLDETKGSGPFDLTRASLIEALVEAYIERDDLDAAENLLERYSIESPLAWPVKVRKVILIASRPHGARELAYAIMEAAVAVDAAISYTDPAGDPFELLRGSVSDLTDLVTISVSAFQAGNITAELLRGVADLQASPVGGRRFRGEQEENAGGLLTALDDQILDVLTRSEATLVQGIVNSNGELELIVTSHKDGSLCTDHCPIGLKKDALDVLGKRVAFKMNQQLTTAHDPGLDVIPGWTETSECLQASVARFVPFGSALAIAPGPFDVTLLSLALGERHPIAFLPNLAGLPTLMARRDAARGAGHVADFSVWRAGDHEALVSALETGEDELRSLCEGPAAASTYQSYVGRSATSEALIAALSKADILRLSAHGDVDPDAGSFYLLVAANDGLPPRAVEAVSRLEAAEHRLEWSRLADLNRAAAIVISTACESGLVVTSGSGERLGLERPLFSAGTAVFAAPLWEAPVSDVQALSLDIVRRLFEEPHKSVSQVVWDAQTEARNAGMPMVASRCIGVFGAPN